MGHAGKSERSRRRPAGIATQAFPLGRSYAACLRSDFMSMTKHIYIVFQQPLIGLVHRLDRDDLDIGDDIMRAAEVEHLLRLLHPADGGPRDRLAAADQAAAHNRRLKFGQHPDDGHGPVALQQREIGVEVMRYRHGVEQEVETAGRRLIAASSGEISTSSAPSACVRRLAGRGCDHHDMRAERLGEFDAHMAEATKADDADFLARAHLPVALAATRW